MSTAVHVDGKAVKLSFTFWPAADGEQACGDREPQQDPGAETRARVMLFSPRDSPDRFRSAECPPPAVAHGRRSLSEIACRLGRREIASTFGANTHLGLGVVNRRSRRSASGVLLAIGPLL